MADNGAVAASANHVDDIRIVEQRDAVTNVNGHDLAREVIAAHPDGARR
jgi:hypothetical protein